MNVKPQDSQKYALVSVFDKTGIVDLVKLLKKRGVLVIATGATAKHLKKNKLDVISIEQITKMPESFGGRVKTISFQVFSGILFDRDNKLHQKQANKLQIPSIDFIICNFYPFWENPGIELIDIGGPTMVRAAAQNFKSVTVFVSPKDYEFVGRDLSANGHTHNKLQ